VRHSDSGVWRPPFEKYGGLCTRRLRTGADAAPPSPDGGGHVSPPHSGGASPSGAGAGAGAASSWPSPSGRRSSSSVDARPSKPDMPPATKTRPSSRAIARQPQRPTRSRGPGANVIVSTSRTYARRLGRKRRADATRLRLVEGRDLHGLPALRVRLLVHRLARRHAADDEDVRRVEGRQGQAEARELHRRARLEGHRRDVEDLRRSQATLAFAVVAAGDEHAAAAEVHGGEVRARAAHGRARGEGHRCEVENFRRPQGPAVAGAAEAAGDEDPRRVEGDDGAVVAVRRERRAPRDPEVVVVAQVEQLRRPQLPAADDERAVGVERERRGAVALLHRRRPGAEERRHAGAQHLRRPLALKAAPDEDEAVELRRGEPDAHLVHVRPRREGRAVEPARRFARHACGRARRRGSAGHRCPSATPSNQSTRCRQHDDTQGTNPPMLEEHPGPGEGPS